MREQDIAELCKKRDRNGQKALYEGFAPRLLAICLRYTGNRAAAEDLLHDGFLKIFNSFDKYSWRGEGSLRAWTSRIMVNLSIEYLKKNKLMQMSPASDNDIPDEEEPQVVQVADIPQSVVMQFISELPAGYRTVFNLYVFENKSHSEIANILGINEKSSSSQLSRAKKMLAGKINAYIDAVNKTI